MRTREPRDGGLPGSLTAEEYDEALLIIWKLNRAGKSDLIDAAKGGNPSPRQLLRRLRRASR